MDQAEPSVQPLEVPPPLVGRATRRFPVGHLSYSALDLYGRCSYRYYAERMLGLPPFETDEAGLGGARGLAIGNAVHSLLEWSARRSWREPGPNELAAALAVAGAAGEPGATATVSEMVNAWLGSDSLAELRAGGFSLRPEVPFAVELGGTIVRGKIDLLAEREGEITVVDYKTNALAGTTPREVAMRYRVQRDVYAVAAATHRPAATRLTTVYSFLRAVSEPVTDAHDTRSLADARTRLEGLIAAIRAGRFHPAERPDRPLCAGCPASANLCPRAAWRP
jgi:RecB family exonuclease